MSEQFGEMPKQMPKDNRTPFQQMERVDDVTKKDRKKEKEFLKKEIQESISENDENETRKNLEKFTEGVENLDAKELEDISTDLRGLARNAIKEKNEKISEMVIGELGNVGKVSLENIEKGENKFKDTIMQIIESLKDIGELSANEKFESGAEQAVVSLKEIGMVLSDTECEIKIARTMGDIGAKTAINGLEKGTLNIIQTLKEFGLNKDGDVTFITISSLEDIGKGVENAQITKENLDEILTQSACAIYEIGDKKKGIYADRGMEGLELLEKLVKNKQSQTEELIKDYIEGLNAIIKNE